MPILTTVLAEAEALAGDMDAGLETIELALAATERQGERWFAAETNRIRGEILLKRDLGDTAPAEEAYRTAIAIAQQQKAQSFELRATSSGEPRAALARRGQAAASSRTARSSLRVVHGRLGHARSEGSSGAARRVARLKTNFRNGLLGTRGWPKR
jgi:hypothetical protein